MLNFLIGIGKEKRQEALGPHLSPEQQWQKVIKIASCYN